VKKHLDAFSFTQMRNYPTCKMPALLMSIYVKAQVLSNY
jgi:hypothetical protein